MGDGIAEKVRCVDESILTDVVRRSENSPSFEITGWEVERLSDKGLMNPDGLWLYRGDGRDGDCLCEWSVVLKILHRNELPLDHFMHWSRELRFAESGLSRRLPGPVRAPQYYRTEEKEDGAWLWMEHIVGNRAEPWTLNDWAFAANQLGRWNGSIVADSSIKAERWFTRECFKYWYAEANPEKDYEFQLNQDRITGSLRKRQEQVWRERQAFHSAQCNLPQCLSHLDSNRNNLFIRSSDDGSDELVMIDWANLGTEPLGMELVFFVMFGIFFFHLPFHRLVELDRKAFECYLEGLHQAGWDGDPDTVRLAYVAAIAEGFGAVLPNILSHWCTEERRDFTLQHFGKAEEELYDAWVAFLPYCLDCADEARHLMRKFRLQ